MAFESDSINAIDFATTGNVALQGTITTANTIYIGNLALTNDGSNTMSIGGQPVVTQTSDGNVTATGNISTTANISGGNIISTANIRVGGQIQSSSFSGGNISWSTANQTDFQGAIKVGGTGRILSPGGAASITLNNNGANIPLVGVTLTSNSTSTTSGGLQVVGGAGIGGNVYVGLQVVAAGNVTGNNLSAITSTGLAVYANTTARDTAIAAPVTGMMAFLNDGNVVCVYGVTGWGNIALT